MWRVTMWSFILLLLSYPNLVESQADDHRLRLKDGSNPCEGKIQVYHNKIWGYVGVQSLSENDKKVACRSIECGEPKSSVSMMLPQNSTLWLHELSCNGSERHLWDCSFSQWSASAYKGQTVEKITCSNTIKLSLEEFACKGKVQYSKDGKTPSGYICGDKWGQKEGNVLCQSLNCGDAKPIPKQTDSRRNNPKKQIQMISTNCLGGETNLWECAPKTESCSEPAQVYCEAHQRVRVKGNSSNVCSGTLEEKQGEKWKSVKNQSSNTTLDRWCKHMYCGSYEKHTQTKNGTDLTCSDKVRVVLLDNNKPSRCYGTVHLEVNGKHSPVCGTDWMKNTNNFAMVCKELGCGKVIYKAEKRATFTSQMNGVSCTEDDLSLWHCEGTHSSQQCQSQAYVVCSDSTKVMLKDGPGRCAGRLEIFYEGQLQKARKSAWTQDNSNTVCKHLGCGNHPSRSSTPKQFSNGPSKYLDKNIKCGANAKSLFDCTIMDNNNPSRDEQIVDIICDGHKDLFLSEDFCSGEVRIQTVSGETHWLSGAEDSWNKASADVVCAQRRCGTAQNFAKVTKFNTSDISIWNTFDCPSPFTSLFDCKNNIISPDANSTDPIEVASVTCTGNKTMTLTETCWGFVNICENGQCGGMCAEAWTDDNAKKLCQRLGCGETTVPAKYKDSKAEVVVDFKSLHPLAKDNLTKSHIVKREANDTSCSGNAAYIVCIGSYKPRFFQPKDYCSGNVQLYQEDKWLPLCKEALTDTHTLNIMCGQLNCGQAVQSIDYSEVSEKTEYVSELQCPANSESLKSCTKSSIKPYCTLSSPPRGLQCSDWKKIVLLKGEDACSGVVFVYSNGENPAAVSAAGWTGHESRRLCEDLNCGNEGGHKVKEMIKDVPFWKGSFNCTGIESPQNIWHCEKKEPPKENNQLFIKCSESPRVNLTQKCHGKVMINGLEVCDTLWDPSYSHLVCQEKKCSDAIDGSFTTVPPQSRSKAYHHVSCEKYHDKLGQCRRFQAPCKGNLVTVYCRGNIKYNTTEKCGGDIEVSFQDGTRDKVCFSGELPLNIRDNLCKNCGGPDSTAKNSKQLKMDLNASLTCTSDHQDISSCVSKKACTGEPAQLFCKDYMPPQPPPPPNPAVLIVLGLLLIVIVTAAALLLLRFYLIRNNKTIKDLLPKFSKQKEEDFESGEYEDVPSKDFSGHGLHVLTSEADAAGENNASTSSLGYDDVDELAEAQPLTSEDPQRTPDEDYEAEDLQDSYDDIDASVDVVQVAAEVHPTPKGMEDVPGKDPDLLVLGEDDYLVPGQDA